MRKPKMGSPMTEATTATMTMTAVWLTSLEDFWMMKTIMLTISMQIEMKMEVMNSMKYLQFRLAMQVPTKPQWWSKIQTQLLQVEQWLARLGRKTWQVPQKRAAEALACEPSAGATGISKRWEQLSLRSSRKGRLGMMPGLEQAVRQRKKYINAMQARKMMGSAGLTSQLTPTTKTQKGTVIPKEQQQIQSIPGSYFAGPVTQHPQRKRLWEGQTSCILGISLFNYCREVNLPSFLESISKGGRGV